MATRCSSTGAALFLSLLLLPASLVVHGAGDDVVKAACADTPYPESCESVLSASPEITKAAGDERVVAEVAVRAAAKAGAAAAALARAEQKGIKDGAWWCMDACAADMEDAASRLRRGRLAEVRRFIDRTEGDSVVWNCDECRPDEPAKNKTDLISKENDLEKMMGVVSVLVKRVRTAKGATATATASPEQAPEAATAPAPY